jgi:hypothetical protein
VSLGKAISLKIPSKEEYLATSDSHLAATGCNTSGYNEHWTIMWHKGLENEYKKAFSCLEFHLSTENGPMNQIITANPNRTIQTASQGTALY